MHQRRKLTLCLVAGVLVLAVSAAAAFGSVNGYDRYKQAVKQLLTQEENLTLQAQVNLAMDGAEVFAWQGTYAKDGADSARTSCTHSGEVRPTGSFPPCGMGCAPSLWRTAASIPKPLRCRPVGPTPCWASKPTTR